MSITTGKRMYEDTRNPRQRPIDPKELRRSGIARGKAMHQADHGDREAREALSAARENAETPPPSAV